MKVVLILSSLEMYLAPEYFMYGKVNEKTDVYSFGVVLLELITGRKPINDKNPKGQESLVMWARPLLAAGSVKELAGPLLEDAYDISEMKKMVIGAACCLRQAAQFRPRKNRMAGLLSAKVPLLSISKGSTHPGLTAMRSVTEASRTNKVFFRTIPRAGEHERNAAEEARETADNTAEKSKRMAEEAKEKAKGTTYEAKEKTKSAAEEAQNKAAEMKEKAREKSEGVGQRVKETTGQATEKVQSIGGQAKQKVQEAWDMAKGTGQKVKETVVGKAEDTKETVEEKTESAKRKVNE